METTVQKTTIERRRQRAVSRLPVVVDASLGFAIQVNGLLTRSQCCKPKYEVNCLLINKMLLTAILFAIKSKAFLPTSGGLA